MSIGRIANPVDMAVSALRAQALRMKVIAGNIANVGSSRTESGGPYRRKEVSLFAAGDGFAGVRIGGIVDDMSTALKRLHQPGHPDADSDGFVSMPNIDLPVEMMQMVAASRAYQANAATLKRYQEMVDVTLELLR